MEDVSQRSHVFTSLYLFSDEAQHELELQFLSMHAGFDVVCEWLDDSNIRILSNSEEIPQVFADLYIDYIKNEKSREHEIYETAKVERMLGTLPRSKQQSKQIEDDSDASGGTPVVELIPHEIISKPWSFDLDVQKKIPKRLLQPGIFEKIASLGGCRVVQGSHGDVMVVKGDSHNDVDKTIAALDGMVERLSIRYLRFPVYNFAFSKRKANVLYRLIAMDEPEAYLQRFRSLMRKAGLRKRDSSRFVIIRKTTESSSNAPVKGISRQSVHLSLDHYWNKTKFEPFGQHRFDYSISRSALNGSTGLAISTMASTHHPVHRTIEEWVNQSKFTEHNPFMPLRISDQNSEQGAPSSEIDQESDIVDGSSKQDSALKKRHSRARRHPVEFSVTLGNVKEEDQFTASEQADSTADATNSITSLYSYGEPSFSITPLHTSIAHETLPADIFPVINPLPAIAGPYMPPSTPGRMIMGGPQEPAWLAKNPTNETLISKATPLIRSSGAQAESEAQTKNHWLEETSIVAAAVTERIATTNEADERQLRRTMRQKNPKPSSPTGATQPMELSCSKILQVAQESRGLLIKLEVEIGIILLEKATLPFSYSQRKTLTAEELPELFPMQGTAKTETKFINGLTLSPLDIKFISDLKSSNGKRFFQQEPDLLNTKCEFLCGIKSSAEEVLIQFQDGRCRVFGTDHTLGTIQWHFPDHEWDARLAVKGFEPRTDDFHNESTAVAKNLSITPSPDGETVAVTAELPTGSDLYFKSATARRELVFQCDADPDLQLVCTEVSMLGETTEELRYAHSMRDKAIMMQEGDLWWEVRLTSKRASDILQNGQNLSSKLIEAGILRLLHDLTRNIVSRIDSIGKVQGSAKSGTTAQGSSLQVSRKPADSQGGDFW